MLLKLEDLGEVIFLPDVWSFRAHQSLLRMRVMDRKGGWSSLYVTANCLSDSLSVFLSLIVGNYHSTSIMANQ